MHIRGHLTPFSQSLANQGMQQTYQNMNQAPLQNYTNFLGGSMNLGMQPYQSSGNMMPNNNIMDYITDPEPIPDVINPPSYVPDLNPIVPDVPEENLLTGDAYNEFTQLVEQIVAAQGGNVDYSFVDDLQNSFIDMLQQGSSPQSISYNLFQDFIQQNNLQLDYNQDGVIDVEDIIAGLEQGQDVSGIGAIIDPNLNTLPPLLPPYTGPPIFSDFSNVIPGQLNLGFEDIPYLPPYTGPPIFPDFTDVLPGGDLGLETEPEIIPEPVLPDFSQPVFPDFSNVIPGELNLDTAEFPGFGEQIDQITENVENILAIKQAPQFTGGGGQGGQAARRLYFPGTSGGFASVGTGIGGGGTTLDDLLKRMR